VADLKEQFVGIKFFFETVGKC